MADNEIICPNAQYKSWKEEAFHLILESESEKLQKDSHKLWVQAKPYFQPQSSSL